MSRLLKNKFFTVAVALAGFMTLSGCGAANNVGAGAYGVAGLGNCVPISGLVTFTATNFFMDNTSLNAGPATDYQTYGQVLMGGGSGANLVSSQGVDGVMGVSIPNYNPLNYPSLPVYNNGSYLNGNVPYGTAMTGYLQISQQTQSNILGQVAYGMASIGNLGIPSCGLNNMPNPWYPSGTGTGCFTTPAQVCVSQLGIRMNYSGNRIWGVVDLYLNGAGAGQTPVALYF
ncbi:hypothetical protein K2X30_12320 [bacterium]|nr:hypothetical protein [bacterium]